MKIGFIGTGNMGKILIQALIESETVNANDIIVTNRTIEKAEQVKKTYPEITVLTETTEVAKRSNIVFVCVKPIQFYDVLTDIRTELEEDDILVSITSPILTSELERVVSCQVARVIPSITNRSLSGCSLVTFGKRIDEQRLLNLLKGFSHPVLIDEEHTRIASDIVSCGPAFFSYLIQRFVESAARQTTISKQQAEQLASEMFIGFGKLLEKKIYTLETLQAKVSVKGGVTGVGIDVLEKEVGDLFDQLILATHQKYDEDRSIIKQQFSAE